MNKEMKLWVCFLGSAGNPFEGPPQMLVVAPNRRSAWWKARRRFGKDASGRYWSVSTQQIESVDGYQIRLVK